MSTSPARKIWILFCLFSLPAWAVLGQTQASIKADQVRLHGRMTLRQHTGYRVARVVAPNGIVLREYVSPAGLVFGLTWRGPRPPDMAALLGAYFQTYRQAAMKLRRHRGPWVLRIGDLIISMSGHMRAFHGSAWLQPLLPAGMTAAEGRLEPMHPSH